MLLAASMAFINVGKARGFFAKDECDYGLLLSEFFGSSCAPGARDFSHNHGSKSDEHDSLCTLCQVNVKPRNDILARLVLDGDVVEPAPISSADTAPIEIEGDDRAAPTEASADVPAICSADDSNRYHGNGGALRCLSEDGDVAILERQYLNEYATAQKLNSADFRVLCRNGSLAAYPGFDVDADCLLTKIVDGEVVVRRDVDKLAGTMNVLLSLDKYLQSDPKFKMYNHYNGVTDLLFKDTTFGLEAHNSTDVSKPVHNYRQLFEDLEKCTSGAGHQSATALLATVLMVALAKFIF